jgi:N-acetylmuramoyl-L-alanine amidase
MKKIYLSPSDQIYNIYAAGNTNEAVQCRKIAVALVAALERCGFQAKTDTTDAASMYDRVRQSNDWGADLHIAIHTNAHNGQVKGTRLFCYDKTGEGYQACAAIMATLAPITPGESDSITVHHFYEVRDAHAPTVYLEVAFHDNKEEAAWIVDHIDEIAEAVCQGVCTHYGVDYANPEVKEQVAEEPKWYRVQVGAFRNPDYAKALLERLQAAGFTDAYIRD